MVKTRRLVVNRVGLVLKGPETASCLELIKSRDLDPAQVEPALPASSATWSLQAYSWRDCLDGRLACFSTSGAGWILPLKDFDLPFAQTQVGYSPARWVR